MEKSPVRSDRYFPEWKRPYRFNNTQCSFRIVNYKKEARLVKVFAENVSCTPQSLNVPDRLCLHTHEHAQVIVENTFIMKVLQRAPRSV